MTKGKFCVRLWLFMYFIPMDFRHHFGVAMHAVFYDPGYFAYFPINLNIIHYDFYYFVRHGKNSFQAK